MVKGDGITVILNMDTLLSYTTLEVFTKDFQSLLSRRSVYPNSVDPNIKKKKISNPFMIKESNPFMISSPTKKIAVSPLKFTFVPKDKETNSSYLTWKPSSDILRSSTKDLLVSSKKLFYKPFTVAKIDGSPTTIVNSNSFKKPTTHLVSKMDGSGTTIVNFNSLKKPTTNSIKTSTTNSIKTSTTNSNLNKSLSNVLPTISKITKLFHHSRVHGRKGMFNLGNTCYVRFSLFYIEFSYLQTQTYDQLLIYHLDKCFFTGICFVLFKFYTYYRCIIFRSFYP